MLLPKVKYLLFAKPNLAYNRQLVELAIKTDPIVKITARTLENDGYSAKILIKNHFTAIGTVIDPEDGEVWEWVYEGK